MWAAFLLLTCRGDKWPYCLRKRCLTPVIIGCVIWPWPHRSACSSLYWCRQSSSLWWSTSSAVSTSWATMHSEQLQRAFTAESQSKKHWLAFITVLLVLINSLSLFPSGNPCCYINADNLYPPRVGVLNRDRDKGEIIWDSMCWICLKSSWSDTISGIHVVSQEFSFSCLEDLCMLKSFCLPCNISTTMLLKSSNDQNMLQILTSNTGYCYSIFSKEK